MNNKLIKKNLENTSYYWWLRSASSDYSYDVGYVYGHGCVYSSDANCYVGVAPACLII